MKKSLLVLLTIATSGTLSLLAERTETLLDGNNWTLDGLPVLVPDCWNKIDGSDGDTGEAAAAKVFVSSVPATSYTRKRGLYSRDLPDAKPNRRYFVRCEGASQVAAVRVNGIEIGSHKGAFTAFCFEATSAMKPSGNILEIEISNEFDPDIPPVSGDFTLAGGLYRSVWLIETDPVCIDPTIDGGPGVRVFPSMDGTVRVEADISGATDAEIDWEPKKVPDPELWSPESPNVYSVKVTVRKGGCVDTVVESFGFRTTEIRDDGFYLNGVRRKVRGVNRHQDLEGAGWEQTAAQEERDIRMIKAMGADGLRLAHYPQSRNMYDLCDRMGLMVWSEIPVVDCVGGEAFRENAKTMLREMIVQHRNHPCVCWWGVWNELGNIPHGAELAEANGWAEFSAGLSALSSALDPSRPVVAATCKPKMTALNASVPNIAWNIYPLWYEKETLREVVDGFFALNPVSTLALSEYGAGGSVLQHENPVRRPDTVALFHPEEYQTFVHIADARDIWRDDRLWGAFVWAMFDFAADARCEGDRRGINDKGLVTRDRVTAKDAWFFYKANWNPEPMLHLCGKRMSATSNPAVDVTVFSNAGPVTLKVNGETVAVKEPDEVCEAIFPAVRLADGDNEISVEAGGLVDGCRLFKVSESEGVK